MDNFYVAERLAGEEQAGRASVGPGLNYRFRHGSDVELVCIDSSRRFLLFGKRFFEHPNHAPFLECAFPAGPATAPRWRIPFSHHPPYCAGPMHGNSKSSIEHLVPLYRRSGVRLVLSGHEHNFQHSRADGIDYFVTGGGGKVRVGPSREDGGGAHGGLGVGLPFPARADRRRRGARDAHRRRRPPADPGRSRRRRGRGHHDHPFVRTTRWS